MHQTSEVFDWLFDGHLLCLCVPQKWMTTNRLLRTADLVLFLGRAYSTESEEEEVI